MADLRLANYTVVYVEGGFLDDRPFFRLLISERRKNTSEEVQEKETMVYSFHLELTKAKEDR